jgi:hypothetical protein
MGFKVRQITLRRICVGWALLTAIHWGLYLHFPEFAPVFVGKVPVWIREFRLLEGIFALAAITAAFLTTAKAITDRSIKKVDKVGFLLFVILFILLISLYLF